MDWRRHAVCRDEDPELFFPIGHGGPALRQIQEAKDVCARCPAIGDCLQYAMGAGEDSGIWGGPTEHERRSRAARERADSASPS